MKTPNMLDAKKRNQNEIKYVDYDKNYDKFGSGKSFFVRTYGCQMNEHDSEKIRGMMKSAGFKLVDSIENADVVIVAGCGIHNNTCETSEHDGIHTFYLEPGAKVKYIEKHYGEGNGTGDKILNPQTIVHLKENSSLEMETVQIEGVSSTVRETTGDLAKNTNLVITEKIMTSGNQFAKTIFNVELNGENSSVHVTSRSVAKDTSSQEFYSNVSGNSKCFGHVECDAIIMDNAKIIATPRIVANNIDASLIHEAAIGKIAGEQLTKLMTLGLTEKEAEEQIISGFLK